MRLTQPRGQRQGEAKKGRVFPTSHRARPRANIASSGNMCPLRFTYWDEASGPLLCTENVNLAEKQFDSNFQKPTRLLAAPQRILHAVQNVIMAWSI